MEEERHAKEKIIKDIMKRKIAEIVVKNPVECYKQKLTLPHKKNNTIRRTNITVLYFEHPSSHCAIIIIL